jgi:hypothetical protein
MCAKGEMIFVCCVTNEADTGGALLYTAPHLSTAHGCSQVLGAVSAWRV